MPIPSKAIRNAKMALIEREKFKPKPMTRSGLLTARLISNGKVISHFRIFFSKMTEMSL